LSPRQFLSWQFESISGSDHAEHGLRLQILSLVVAGIAHRRELGGPQEVRTIAESTMKPSALMSTESPSRTRFQRLS